MLKMNRALALVSLLYSIGDATLVAQPRPKLTSPSRKERSRTEGASISQLAVEKRARKNELRYSCAATSFFGQAHSMKQSWPRIELRIGRE